jgi:glycosyltransferase involved in cell wall biosynthesis
VHILHVIPSLAPRDGGPTVATLAVCRELIRRGQQVEIYTTNADGEGCLDVPLEAATHVRGIDITYFPINGSHYYKISRAMASALHKNIPRFQLVHINSLYQFPSSIAAYYCRKYQIPYILRPHGTLDPYLYRRHPLRKRLYEALIERRNLATAAAVQFTTAEEMKLASSFNLRFRGIVIPHGVEIDTLPPACTTLATSLWPELNEKRVVLFLGRINFKKGLDILVAAFGRVLRQRRDTHLVLAGPDTNGYEARVRRWLAEEQATHNVTFTGMVERERKISLLNRADLFVLPSYTENFGIAVVEAMAAGLPVLVSNRVNLWPEIQNAGAGIVINPDVGELTTALLTLLDHPSHAMEMGARGRLLALERFSWESVGERLMCLYREITRELCP